MRPIWKAHNKFHSGDQIRLDFLNLNKNEFHLIQVFMLKLLAAVLSLLLLLPAIASAGAVKGSLIKQASVTRSEAENIALSKVPDGKILQHDLKKERGRIIWF